MLTRKNCFLLGRRGGVFADRGVTQKGSREQAQQSMMVGDRWVKKSNFSVT